VTTDQSRASLVFYEEVGDDAHLMLTPVTDEKRRAAIEAAMRRLSFTAHRPERSSHREFVLEEVAA